MDPPAFCPGAEATSRRPFGQCGGDRDRASRNAVGRIDEGSSGTGLKLLDELGADTVLWASDYPHGDSVWPYSHETVEREMAGIDEAVVRKITRDNARRLYLGEA